MAGFLDKFSMLAIITSAICYIRFSRPKPIKKSTISFIYLHIKHCGETKHPLSTSQLYTAVPPHMDTSCQTIQIKFWEVQLMKSI